MGQPTPGRLPIDTPAMAAAQADPQAAEPVLHTDPALAGLLDELRALEPLFHAAHPEATPERFAELVAPGFWEVGASGRRYSRAFALRVLQERSATRDGPAWEASDHHLAPAGPGHYLLTYTLREPFRVTRRLTVWRHDGAGWQAVYHQGTVVADVGGSA